MTYTISDRLILRTPLEPVRCDFTKEDIIHFFKKQKNSEALFLSSPNLYVRFKKLINGEITEEKESRKLILALYKYALRMHNRCTPFGLFAACNVVNFSSETSINFLTNSISRISRLDMSFIAVLASYISTLPSIRKKIIYTPNSTYYAIGDKYRYIEYHSTKGYREYEVSSIIRSKHLQKILALCSKGKTLSQLVSFLEGEGHPKKEAEGFVNKLVNSQLIVSELEPPVTGNENLNVLIDKLTSLKNQGKDIKDILFFLREVKLYLEKIDLKIFNEPYTYEVLIQKLQKLQIPLKENQLIQVDTFATYKNDCKGKATLDESIKEELYSAVNFLKCFAYKNNQYLEEFKKSFVSRYEDDEIQLGVALDPEVGVGYAKNKNGVGDIAPLLSGLGGISNSSKENELKWNKLQTYLFNKLSEALSNNQKIVRFQSNELDGFSSSNDSLADSYSVIFSSIPTKNKKNRIHLKAAGGSTAAIYLGRFAYGNSDIEKLARSITEKEKLLNKDSIIAEIVHLPQERAGNIIKRIKLRDFEIPYLASSSVKERKQTLLEDLTVSVRDDKIILRSKSNNKKVIPKLSNAHEFTINSLPVYHFLSDMQNQDKIDGYFFNWGNLSNHYTFLPRVEVNNTIIFEARWQFAKVELQDLVIAENDLDKKLKIWRRKWNVPSQVLFSEGDNELLINFESEMGISLFRSLIKKKSNIVLKEWLFEGYNPTVKDKLGNSYSNEFIASFFKEDSDERLIEKNFLNKTKKIDSSFSIGSEWLYFKIYCGVKTADQVLIEIIRPLSLNLIKSKLIDSWFFIRYADPDLHIRVRFHLIDSKDTGAVIKLFHEEIKYLEHQKLVWKIQSDTYKREMKRYGGNAIKLSETIFFQDSICITKFLDLIEGKKGEELRWQFGFILVNQLLRDFGLSLNESFRLLSGLSEAYAVEFGVNKNFKLKLDKKYRANRKLTEELLLFSQDISSEELTLLRKLAKEKSNRVSSVIDKLKTKLESDDLSVNYFSLIQSHIHMTLNRLFRSKQRYHELVIYNFMARTFKSEIAKRMNLKK